MLQWGLAGFKGSSEIEGVIDKAIEAAQKQSEQGGDEQPDPSMVAAQMAEKLEQLKQQGDLSKIQAKAEADAQTRQLDMQADIQTAHETHLRKIAETEAAMQAKLAEVQASLQADLLMEQAQANSNIMQTQATVEGEIQKDIVEHEIDMAAEQEKTSLKMQEIATAAAAKIKEQQVKPSTTPSKSDDD